MAARIEIASDVGPSAGRGIPVALSVVLVEPQHRGALAEIVTLRITTNHGASDLVELSRAEAEIVAVLLNKIVEDFDLRRDAPLPERVIADAGRTITRDELIRALLTLPRSAEINAKIAGEYIGIVGLERAGDGSDPWWALKLNPRCVRDVMSAWRVPLDRQDEVLRDDL